MVNELIVKQMPPDRAERMCDSELLIEINVVIGPTKVHLIDGFHLWRTEQSRQLNQWFYICYRAGPSYKPCPNLSPHLHGGQTRAEQHNEAKRFHLGMSCWDLQTQPAAQLTLRHSFMHNTMGESSSSLSIFIL